MDERAIPIPQLDKIGGSDHIDLHKIDPGHLITIADGTNVWHLSRLVYVIRGRNWVKGVMMHGDSMGTVRYVNPLDMCVDRHIVLNRPFWYGGFPTRMRTCTQPVTGIYVNGHLLLRV